MPTGILYIGNTGHIDFGENADRFNGESFTFLASLTKIITTTCLMKLVKDNKVGLDKDVRRLLPELANMQILRGFDADDTTRLEDNIKPSPSGTDIPFLASNAYCKSVTFSPITPAWLIISATPTS